MTSSATTCVTFVRCAAAVYVCGTNSALIFPPHYRPNFALTTNKFHMWYFALTCVLLQDASLKLKDKQVELKTILEQKKL